MPGFGLHGRGVRGTTRPAPPQPPRGLQFWMLSAVGGYLSREGHSIHFVLPEGSKSAICFQATNPLQTWSARAPSLVPS